MRIIQCIQSSGAWWKARRGRVTASCFDRILTAKKAEPSAQQEDYIAELCADVIFQGPNYFSENGVRNKPPNAAMQQGIDREPEARRFVAHELDCRVQQVGCLVHDGNVISSSPDGLLIAETGEMFAGVELKNPLLSTHARYLMKPESLLMDYRAQCAGHLIVSELPLWYLISYCPPLKTIVLEVRPDDYMKRLQDELLAFVKKYNETLLKVVGFDLQEMIRRLHPSDVYENSADCS